MQHSSLRAVHVPAIFSLLLGALSLVAQDTHARIPADHLDTQPAAEVLVLGSYHMNNPGRDIFNLQADDVLAPKRQAEMRDLLDALKKFRPTKIAFEADSDSPKVKTYADYLAGKHELSRDEREQIGYRLGKELNLPKIYGIDADGDFPFSTVQDYAKAHGRDKELESLMNDVGKFIKADDEFLKTHTITEMLMRINSDDSVRSGLKFYSLSAHYGERYNYAGGELLTSWYRRNVRIHTHLLQILEPGDRVLVIFGSGHLPLLRQFVEQDPTLKLRTLAEFVGHK